MKMTRNLALGGRLFASVSGLVIFCGLAAAPAQAQNTHSFKEVGKSLLILAFKN